MLLSSQILSFYIDAMIAPLIDVTMTPSVSATIASFGATIAPLTGINTIIIIIQTLINENKIHLYSSYKLHAVQLLGCSVFFNKPASAKG